MQFGAQDTSMNKKGKIDALTELTVQWEEAYSKQISTIEKTDEWKGRECFEWGLPFYTG